MNILTALPSHDQLGNTGHKTGFWIEECAGFFMKAADWHPHFVVDGLLITGQNPASAEDAAKALLAKLSAP